MRRSSPPACDARRRRGSSRAARTPGSARPAAPTGGSTGPGPAPAAAHPPPRPGGSGSARIDRPRGTAPRPGRRNPGRTRPGPTRRPGTNAPGPAAWRSNASHTARANDAQQAMTASLEPATFSAIGRQRRRCQRTRANPIDEPFATGRTLATESGSPVSAAVGAIGADGSGPITGAVRPRASRQTARGPGDLRVEPRPLSYALLGRWPSRAPTSPWFCRTGRRARTLTTRSGRILEVRVENVIRDLNHGLRQLARRPGFAAAAIASLAMGVGLNTTLFSVVNAVLLRDTPIERARPAGRDLLGPHRRFAAPHHARIPTSFRSARALAAFAGLAAHAPRARHPLERRQPSRAGDRRSRSPRTTSTCSASGPRSAAASCREENVVGGRAPGGRPQPWAVAAALRRPPRRAGPDARDLRRRPTSIVGVAPPRLLRDGARHRARVLGAGDDGRAAQLLGHPEQHGRRPGHDAHRASAASAGCS